MPNAPIVLFVYNRPEHARRTLEALERNTLATNSELFIYADGPKAGIATEGIENIKAVRNLIREKKWCGKVHLIESESNKGLANSILSGASEIIQSFGKAIILEDDHVTSPWFLQYMNDALNLYEQEEQVVCISGYFYPLEGPMPDSFFIKGADCWGWATWKRAWDTFERDGAISLKQLEEKKLVKEFEFEGTFPYIQMLKDQINGRNDSWAIRWYASAFLKNQLTLYPGKSLLANIGADGSGTHGGTTTSWDTAVADQRLVLKKISAQESGELRKKMALYFKGLKLYPQIRLVDNVKRMIIRTLRKAGL